MRHERQPRAVQIWSGKEPRGMIFKPRQHDDVHLQSCRCWRATPLGLEIRQCPEFSLIGLVQLIPKSTQPISRLLLRAHIEQPNGNLVEQYWENFRS